MRGILHSQCICYFVGLKWLSFWLPLCCWCFVLLMLLISAPPVSSLLPPPPPQWCRCCYLFHRHIRWFPHYEHDWCAFIHTYVCCVWPNTLNDARTHPCGIHNLPRWKAVYARNMSIHSIEAYSFISFFHAHALSLPFLCAPILIRLFTRTYLIWRKSKICHYL